MKTWIFNPFVYIAGWKSLYTGLSFMVLTLIVAFYSGTHFNGALDVHVGWHTAASVYIFEQLIAWGSTVILFFLAAVFLSRSRFRFIDIAGTIALARAPMLLAAIMGFIPVLHSTKPENVSGAVLAFAFLMLIPVIWMIALMFNAFTISSNLKGARGIIGFSIALILAEVSSLFLNQLLRQLWVG
jgi:hypothetical protein